MNWRWKDFGPGLITGAADDDPSGIATYTVAGAQFGTQFLWTAWFTWPLMAFVQMACAKLAIGTQKSLTELMIAKFPRPVVLTLISALYFANTLNIAADLAGMADALNELTGAPRHFLVVALVVLITLAIIRLSYKQLSRVLIGLTFFLGAYIIAAFHAEIHWNEIWRDTVTIQWPSQREGWATLVALLGTTISPYLFFWQSSQELEEAELRSEAHQDIASAKLIRGRRADVTLGTFFSNLIMFFVILTAAASLHRAGQTHVQTTADAAAALRPLLGERAVLFYTLGLLGVGLLAIPTLSGSAAFAFAAYYNLKSGLNRSFHEARAFYAFIVFSSILALGIDLWGINPIRALFWSAVVNGILSPFLIAVVLILGSDRHIMKHRHLGPLSRAVLALTILIMAGAAVEIVAF